MYIHIYCVYVYVCANIMDFCSSRTQGRNCAFWRRVIEREREKSNTWCIDAIFLSSSFSSGKSTFVCRFFSHNQPSSLYDSFSPYLKISFMCSYSHSLVDSQTIRKSLLHPSSKRCERQSEHSLHLTVNSLELYKSKLEK